jgi:tetratricopeptide (TPR) repeat protein
LNNPTDHRNQPGQGDQASAGDFSKADLPLAKHLIDIGDLRKARLMLEQLVETAPNAEILVTLASLEIDNPKRQPDALEHIKRALEISPQLSEGWLMLANYWSLRGQPEKQKRCLEKILTYDKNNRDVRDALELIVVKR